MGGISSFPEDPEHSLQPAPPETTATGGQSIESSLTATRSTGNRFIDLGSTGRSGFWTVLLVFFIEAGAFLGASIISVLYLLIAERGQVPSLENLSPLESLVASALPFLFGLPALALGLWIVNRRPFKSLITPRERPRWGRFWRAGLVWLAISALGDLVSGLILSPGTTVFQFQPQAFIPYALAVILLIPIQSATEELTFRGYLMQGIGVATRRVWIAWIVTSIIFGLLHGANNEIVLYGPGLLISYLSLGLLLGWVTITGQGLETALGIHIFNNLYATLFVTFPGSSLPAPAIFKALVFNPTQSTVLLLIGIGLFLLYFYGYELKKGR